MDIMVNSIGQEITFLKLDTRVIKSFDEVLSNHIEVVETSLWSVLRKMVLRKGVAKALQACASSVLHKRSDYEFLTTGNVLRKKIRLPGLFGNKAISAAYSWVKRTQAALLLDYLKEHLSQYDWDRLIVVVFNGSNYPESVLAEASKRFRRVFVEDGFFPGTLQIDPVGINAANSVPRCSAFYKRGRDFSEGGLPTAVTNRPSKRKFTRVDLAPGFVFVPFQVPSDMQVTLHSPWVKDMYHFYDIVINAADQNPEEMFVIKEHPRFKRSVIGTRPRHPRVKFANGNITSELISNARTVVTINSTVGIEALLLGKQVITLGDACYNIQDLVLRANDMGRLNAALALRGWLPEEELRRQFLGFLWNYYLVKGSFAEPPIALASRILDRFELDSEVRDVIANLNSCNKWSRDQPCSVLCASSG